MSNNANINRIGRLRTTPQQVKRIEEAKEAKREAEKSDVPIFATDADVLLREDLFRNPLQEFVALTDYNDEIYAYLVENNLRTDGCLVYLMNKGEVWTTVYVYEHKTNHQARRLTETFVTGYGDWRLVPDSLNRCGNPSSIRLKCAWELWVFHHYFSFPWFPEGDY